MFKISQTQSYAWPVTVQIPIDGGKYEKQTFDVLFQRLPQSRIKEIGAKIEAGELTDKDLCKEVVTGWKGVHDENGEELPYSIKARDQLLDVAMMEGTIAVAFFESIAGAKRKN